MRYFAGLDVSLLETAVLQDGIVIREGKAASEPDDQDGISVNQFVATAVAEKLAAMGTAGFFAVRRERTNFTAFDRLMQRRSGEAPRPHDTIA
jgi:hypothetical protein